MRKNFRFLFVATSAVFAVIVGAMVLANSRIGREVGTNVNFTSSPVQVRFFTGSSWTEWRDMPVTGDQPCQTGELAGKAEIRVRPGMEGVYLAAEAYFYDPLRITVDEDIITVEGFGKAKVTVIAQTSSYSCALVLTKE